jgi:hypothetical protein
MGKAGEKQKRKPKIKDKKQSERFKEAARELGADEISEVFDPIVKQMSAVMTEEKYKDCEMRVYESGEDTVSMRCDVTIRPGRIEVTYRDFELGNRVDNWVTCVGEEKGTGHFAVRGPRSEGSLHRFPGGRILDGWWREESDEGMWRILLKD